MEKTAFLARVRHALGREEASAMERAPQLLEPLKTWGQDKVVAKFVEEASAVGTKIYPVMDMAELQENISNIIEFIKAKSYSVSQDDFAQEAVQGINLPLATDLSQADIGITSVDYALANTGTLVITSETDRHVSLLPMHHIAIVRHSQVKPTMAEALEAELARPKAFPTAWVHATGPSRTADIELTLSTGVHGPGFVYVLLLDDLL
ncbi:MAG: LUD domain-containing protein [Deinococcales bacterium]